MYSANTYGSFGMTMEERLSRSISICPHDDLTAPDELEEVLDDFRSYLDSRRKELESVLTAGQTLDTDDPYLIGHATGMRVGLEMASDLLHSYLMWARRGIRDPMSRDL
jgi:hypothetical protein